MLRTALTSFSLSLSLQLQPQASASLLDGNEPATVAAAPAAATTTTQRGSQQAPVSASAYSSSSPASASPSSASPITPSLIIRKDIHSFNFSDIEVSERPTATLLTELARRSRNGELLHDLSQRAVTATPQPPTTELDDIFISVKTTKNYHDTRLALIIKTWFQLARDQVSLLRSPIFHLSLPLNPRVPGNLLSCKQIQPIAAIRVKSTQFAGLVWATIGKNTG